MKLLIFLCYDIYPFTDENECLVDTDICGKDADMYCVNKYKGYSCVSSLPDPQRKYANIESNVYNIQNTCNCQFTFIPLALP